MICGVNLGISKKPYKHSKWNNIPKYLAIEWTNLIKKLPCKYSGLPSYLCWIRINVINNNNFNE